MTSDLVHRLRTCAAAIAAVDPKNGWVALISDEAADLLVEASNRLDVPEDLRGELMPIMEAAAATYNAQKSIVSALEVALPKAIEGIHYQTPPCPECANISPRTVTRAGRKLIVTCPMCSHAWEYVA